MNHNLGCGHCNRPLEDCDCGVDYEIAYRPSLETEDDDFALFAPVLIFFGVVIALTGIVTCFIMWGDF